MKAFHKLIIELLDRKNIKLLLILALFNILTNSFQVVEIIMTRLLVMNIQSGQFIILIIVITLGIYLLKDVCNGGINILKDSLQNQISNIFYKKLSQAIQKGEILEYNNAQFLIFLKRVKATIEQRLSSDINICISILSAGIGIIGIVVFVNSKGLEYLLIFAFVSLVQVVNKYFYSKEKVGFIRSLDRNIRKQNYYDDLIINKISLREIRTYCLYDWIREKRNQALKINMKKHMRFTYRWTAINFICNFLFFLFETVLILILFYNMRKNKLILADIIALMQAYIFFIAKVSDLVDKILKVYADRIYYEELLEFIEKEEKKPNIKDIRCSKNLLEVDKLSFSYINNKTILNDINMKIGKEEFVAIIGENGSGKSTLAHIILNLIQSYKGDVYIDTKASVSAIFQDFSRFKLKVKENVGIGKIEKIENEEKILKVLYSVGASFINKLPENIETEIGKEFYENGVELSGGQWQKIGIARVIFSDSDIIIFDEPTASLDPLEEREQFLTLYKNIKGKTAIIITHRVGIAKFADRIICIEQGKIVEQGTHNALLSSNGYYAKLYQGQAKWYNMYEE